MKKRKHFAFALTIFVAGIVGFSIPVSAQCPPHPTAEQLLQCGANQVGGQQNADPQQIEGTIENVINILSILIGIVAVVMIMVAGFRYIASAGDPNRINSAKNTLVMAIIGLIIVAIAQVLVRFVINTATTTASSSDSSSSSQGECIQTPYGYYWREGPRNGQSCTP